MPQLARWLTFIEQFDYEIEHRPGVKHGNADGLSRQVTREVRAVKRTQTPATPPTLAERQRLDKEIGAFVSLRLSHDQPPKKTAIQLESEITKKLATQWSDFEVHDGLLYRRYTNTPWGRKITSSCCFRVRIYQTLSDSAMPVSSEGTSGKRRRRSK